ncbi:hypothetical protein BX070DRAFT_213022 [Coemansia spiralis]|nr:hypothetical protein BX070DRAFT_213022 [Coemansia spiralis]
MQAEASSSAQQSSGAISVCTFYCCYLLRSLKPACKNYVYVGSTPDPVRRLRQHNGEISAGAMSTRSRRPWEMLLIVHGFPSKASALQLEWAWQNPHMSRHSNLDAVPIKSRPVLYASAQKKLETKLLVLFPILALAPFKFWPLEVVCPDQELHADLVARAQDYGMPGHMRVRKAAITQVFEQAPLNQAYLGPPAPEEKCCICNAHLTESRPWGSCTGCASSWHLPCLAKHMANASNLPNNVSLVPTMAWCSTCQKPFVWGQAVRAFAQLK